MATTQEGLARLVEREGIDPRIVQAFRTVARADFVPPPARSEAYLDRPIAIGEGQTTSQPSLIARMLDAAAPRPNDKVLEVGTGLGFQTALLSQLVDEVISLERWPSLATAAAENLRRAGVTNAAIVVGDGWKGWAPEAPFDGIVVSAAAEELPVALGEQLAEGGRLVIPLRSPLRGGDEVFLFVKKGGRLGPPRLITPARFVPLVHEPGSTNGGPAE